MSGKKILKPFEMKQFSVCHSKSAMRVGVDAVLVGAWGDVSGNQNCNILDAGCGCGLIALMCAQRNQHAVITGVEIDSPSAQEAALNFQNSPWENRLSLINNDFTQFCRTTNIKFNHILSNPPYFNDGITNLNSARLTARHQGIFSPQILLLEGRKILTDNATVTMIVPFAMADELIMFAENNNYRLLRQLNIKGNYNRPFKRCILEFCLDGQNKKRPLPSIEELILEDNPGVRTKEYAKLCEDFYL